MERVRLNVTVTNCTQVMSLSLFAQVFSLIACK